MKKKLVFYFIVSLSFFSMVSFSYAAGVTIAWGPSSSTGVEGYRIYYGTSSGTYTNSVDAGNVTQYTVSGLDESQTYYFTIRAYNNSSESSNSNEISWSATDTTPPLTPLNVTAANDGTVTWQANTESDLSGYKIYYGTTSRIYGPSIPVDKVTSYSVSGLEEGKTYYFALSAVDTSGNESGYSSECMITIASSEQILPTSPEPGGSGELVSNLTVGSGRPYEVVTGLNSKSLCYIDSSYYSYNGAPEFLMNRTYIKTAGRDYQSTGDDFLSFDVNRDVTVYVLYDDRISTKPSWMAGFVDTGYNFRIYYTVSVYKKDFSAGRIVLGGNGGLGGMYTVIIEEKALPADTNAPEIAISTPTGMGTYETGNSTIDLGGSATDNVGVTQVTWSNSRGGSGTASGTDDWRVLRISLSEGENIITLTAVDSSGNEGSNSLTVTYRLPDTVDPQIVISTPTGMGTYETGNSTIDLGGSATDNVGVTQVTWSNSRGGSGTASGTDDWRVLRISLSEGENIITMTAFDSAGNEGKNSLTVTYRALDMEEPEIAISTPTGAGTYETGSSTIDLGGSATDNVGVTKVTWSNSRGGSGTASGTETWSIQGIILMEGENLISVTASDLAGNEVVSDLTVVYSPVVTQTGSVLVTNLKVASGRAYEISEGLNSESLCYIDSRTYNYNGAPAFLMDGVYIKTAGRDYLSTGDNFLSFDVNRDVTVYVIYDDRINPKPSWMSGFEDTGYDFRIYYTASIYKKDFTAGRIVLGGNGGGGGMYTVVLLPKSTALSVTDLTVASGRAYEISEGLNSESFCYIDSRTYNYNGVPGFLMDGVYIKTAGRDYLSTGDNFLSFDVNRDVTVYVIYDDRINPKPSWMSGFEDTGYDFRIYYTASIYKKDFTAGRIVLGGNGGGGGMYTVVISARQI